MIYSFGCKIGSTDVYTRITDFLLYPKRLSEHIYSSSNSELK